MSLLFGDQCGQGIVGTCPGGSCCSHETLRTCVVGSTDTCVVNDPANGPPSVTVCARTFSPQPFTTIAPQVCGPTVNAYCPWSRSVDNCCMKDSDQQATKSTNGTCHPCHDVNLGDARSIWTYVDGKWN